MKWQMGNFDKKIGRIAGKIENSISISHFEHVQLIRFRLFGYRKVNIHIPTRWYHTRRRNHFHCRYLNNKKIISDPYDWADSKKFKQTISSHFNISDRIFFFKIPYISYISNIPHFMPNISFTNINCENIKFSDKTVSNTYIRLIINNIQIKVHMYVYNIQICI